MEKVQLNFTKTAAQCVTNGMVFRLTITELYDRSFRLCSFTAWTSDKPESWSDALVIHEEEIKEIYNNIKNIINNNNK